MPRHACTERGVVKVKYESTSRSAVNVPTSSARGRTWLAYLFGSLGGVLFGYDSGIIAGAILFIRKDMSLTPQLQGLVVGVLLLGAMIGAFGTGKWADRLGPRKMLFASGVMFIVTSLLSACAPDPASLIAARLLVGLAVGIAQVQVPVYLSEIAPRQIRGALTSLTQLCTAIGIFTSYLVAYLLAPHGQWRLMLALAAVPSVLLTVGMMFQPESPRWLVRQGRRDEALKVLRMTHPDEDAQCVLAEMTEASARAKLPWMQILRSEKLRPVLISVFGLAVFQQLMGINTVVYYAPTILRAAGFGESAALLNSVGLGALSIVMTLCAGRIVDRIGRRPLLKIGAVVMCVSLLIFGSLFQSNLSSTSAGSVVAVTALAIFKAAFSFSWGPVVWVMMPELLPMQIRARVMSAAVLCLFFANFVVSSTFPVLLNTGPLASFGFFAACCALAFFFVVFRLRETAGLSLEEIERDL